MDNDFTNGYLGSPSTPTEVQSTREEADQRDE